MKRIFSFIFVLGLLFLIFQLVINVFKDSHVVNYALKIDNNEILIKEEYKKTKEEEYYFFKLVFNDNTYLFDVPNKFNKQKKIIDDIRIYEKDDLVCISPIYIKNNINADIICSVNGIQTAYTAVIEKNDLTDFTNQLDNFNKDKYTSSNERVMINKMNIYKDNVYEDEYIIIYDYKELIKIKNKIRQRIKFSEYDVYNNEMGRLIENYYILPKFQNKPEYSSFLVINILNNEEEIITFKDEVSTNLYINGVVDNKLYFFDRSNFAQYEIDPKKNNYRIVGNKATNGQYYDGEWTTRNIYDFVNQKITFKTPHPIKGNYENVFETAKYYYYYNNDNEFYKVYKNELNNPIYLFNYKDVKEVQVINDCIYFISEDTIYRYDDTGIKKLVKNNEFKYNYKNIYGVYYK